MKRTNLVMHKDRHQKMLDFQKTITPFTPTIREMAEVWLLGSSTAYHELNVLKGFNLVIERKGSFYAVDGKVVRRVSRG